MKRSLERTRPHLLGPIAILTLAACGSEGTMLDAQVELPSAGAAELTITPAIQGDIIDQLGWGRRLVIEHVAVHLADVRLLGADPRIPAGGLGLLEAPQIVGADGRPEAALHLPVPERFLETEDLAVFLRLEPDADLEGASVEVFGRLYAGDPTDAQELVSSSGRTRTPDPDVDPSRPDPTLGDDRDGTVPDPDVDPSMTARRLPNGPERMVPDPDVDPSRGGDDDGRTTQALVASSGDASVPSVAFVLRDDTVADMVAILGAHSRLDVVVGIPAERWLDNDVVRELESALDREVAQARGQAVQTDDLVRIRRATMGATGDWGGRPADADAHTPDLDQPGARQGDELITSGNGDGELFVTAGQRVEDNRLD